MTRLYSTLMPFLYPCLDCSHRIVRIPTLRLRTPWISSARPESTAATIPTPTPKPTPTFPPSKPSDLHPSTRLDPAPDDYGRTIFVDKCNLTLEAGSGGHGCISFLREKFVADGPPNGGDGGTGGSIYIQAVRGETSLHKIARRRLVKAGRGKNGQGKGLGGQRGEDVLLTVPVGTVVREVARRDPVAEEEERIKIEEVTMPQGDEQEEEETRGQWRRDKWILYPSSLPSDYAKAEFPPLPQARKSYLAASQPAAPIAIDFSEPMEKPILLVAGAPGGLGNPHFVSRTRSRPKFATRGEPGMSLNLELELKLLADVGFVGLPNAGKSTLLRALSRSKARIGDWQFTTLQPNIGTVVLDNHHGRPALPAHRAAGDIRTHISIADIPGLIPDAHLDRGLGLGFLRHVERAQVVAFVVDLGAGDAVAALQGLWRELGAFESLKDDPLRPDKQQRIVPWKALDPSTPIPSSFSSSFSSSTSPYSPSSSTLPPLSGRTPISAKPWFVVATKADLPDSQDNFHALKTYVTDLERGLRNADMHHPSGRRNVWQGRLEVLPVCALRAEGVERIPEWVVALLDD